MNMVLEQTTSDPTGGGWDIRRARCTTQVDIKTLYTHLGRGWGGGDCFLPGNLFSFFRTRIFISLRPPPPSGIVTSDCHSSSLLCRPSWLLRKSATSIALAKFANPQMFTFLFLCIFLSFQIVLVLIVEMLRNSPPSFTTPLV